MLGIALNITSIPSVTLIGRALSTQAGRIRSMEPVLRPAVREIIVPRIRQNFDERGSHSSNEWAPLSDVTWELPERNTKGGPKLDVSGSLKRIATNPLLWDINNQEGTAVVHTGEFRSASTYGVLQHEGGFSPLTGGQIPARPFFDIPLSDIMKIEDMFADFVESRIGGIFDTGGSVEVSYDR